jgi:Tol biopolymer transport system component
MKRALRTLFEIILLGALVGGLALVFRTLVAQEKPGASMGQPYPPPGEAPAVAGASTPQAYPPPQDTLPVWTEEPQPDIITTPGFGEAPPPLTPWPTFTPYPSPTLRPGPTATPVPLREPANDAAGNILYLASGAQDRAALYSLPMDGQGKVKGTPSKRSEELDVTWGRAYVSPDGSRIAVVGEWGASAIIDTASGNLEPMFKDRPNPLGLFFNWYPDSRSILIRAENNYVDVGLWLVNTDTWEHTPLAVPGYGLVHGAAASPDGRKVVYSTKRGISSPSEVWMVNANGRDAHLLFALSGIVYDFAWSPDGSKIVFHGEGVMMMDADGKNLHPLDLDLRFDSNCSSLHSPVWSPNSRFLAYRSDKTSRSANNGWNPQLFEGRNICVIDLESGEARPLLPGNGVGNLQPTWSPDGSQIAFVSNRGDGTSQIWVVNVDGSNLRQVTTAGKSVRFPFWIRE